MGNLLAVVVHVANIHDTKAGIWAAKLGAEAIGTASEYGLHFPQVFKTITVDNGSEFAGFAQTEVWGTARFLCPPLHRMGARPERAAQRPVPVVRPQGRLH